MRPLAQLLNLVCSHRLAAAFRGRGFTRRMDARLNETICLHLQHLVSRYPVVPSYTLNTLCPQYGQVTFRAGIVDVARIAFSIS